MFDKIFQNEEVMGLARLFFLMIIVWMIYGMMSGTMLQPFVLIAGIAVSVVVGLKFYMYLYPPEEREERKREKENENNYGREW